MVSEKTGEKNAISEDLAIQRHGIDMAIQSQAFSVHVLISYLYIYYNA